MSYLNQPEYVRYVCNCGSLKPISKIYFCRHCLKIRCGYCVCQEVDTHYCPNCMENLPSSEVRLKKNKCTNCFECPCCFQTLSTRAGHTPIRVMPTEGEDGKDLKTTPKKVYYLFCSLCRWSSRDAGIPDQLFATGGWPEQENPHTHRINNLIDYHKILASIEKQQKEKEKFQSKRTYMHIAALSITSAAVRKKINRRIIPQAPTQSSAQPQPAVASEDVEELPLDIFTKEVDINKVTTLEQRLKHPDVQAERVDELRPQHRQLLVKRSQRCRTCEHSVTKSDLCSQSTKFKIQLSAFYHVPELRIVTCEPLRRGKSSELLLKFCNPTQHQTQVSLLALDTPMTPPPELETDKDEFKQDNSEGTDSRNVLVSIIHQPSVMEDPKPIKIQHNADLVLPHSSLILPPRDDAAEYDDTGDNDNFQDDPKLVVWRKGNKAIIRLHVTPHEDIDQDKSVIVGFIMQHEYLNTIAALEHKAPQKLDLKVKLYITVGDLVGSA